MQLFAFGINHHCAPLAVRERLAFPAETLPASLVSLQSQDGVREAAILSTCNRTELYCNALDPEAVLQWLAHHHGMQVEEIRPFLYALKGEEAARHAFRVASGLDSMVLGETQILGQMKDAMTCAQEAGTLGLLLNQVFQQTFSVAKAVRTQTEIGANSVSMAAACVRLAQRIFPHFSELSVLLIGAGEMIELCATYLAAQSPKKMTVANRTVARGQALADQWGGLAIPLSDIAQQLPFYDVIITSTGSPLPVLHVPEVKAALKVRRHQPVFMVDLAVPRDIEAEVGALEDVFLYTVDDLAGVVAEGREKRQVAVEAAEKLIIQAVEAFTAWHLGRQAVPLIRSLRDQTERMRRHEVERARKRLQQGASPYEVLEALSLALTNKCLHAPTEALKAAGAANQPEVLDTLARLYHLHRAD